MKSNTDCTLYNKSVVGGLEVWTRHAISGAQWENRKAANVIQSGLLEADSVAVFIPLARGTYTFNQGDILVKGAVTDTISTSFTITDLKAKYADVVSIRSVDKQDYGSLALQHWQIGAK